MKKPLEKFYVFLERPLFGWSRIILAALAIPLALAFMSPLWRIELHAPQYPDGLSMDIWAYKVEGGNHGQHIQEINTLNHYIGMHSIDRAALSDLDWLPFALGALLLLTLRVAAIGNIRSLLDLWVMTSYVTLFGLGRFAYKLYVFGHDLAPDAPIKVAPFMPVLIGEKQIANFLTSSYPATASYWITIFTVGVAGLSLWHLVAGRLSAARAEREAELAAAKAG